MRHARNWRRYIRFWGPNVDADIDDELRFHLEARIAEYERLGHSPEDAARLTLERVGEIAGLRTELRDHDARRLRVHRTREHIRLIGQDLAYGLRRARRAPGFSVAVIAVLAIGIGLNTAVFSAIDAVFLRPLPFPHAEQLMQLGNLELEYSFSGITEFSGGKAPQSYPYVRDMTKVSVLSSVAAYAVGGLDLEGGRAPSRISVAHVSLDFFRTMGRSPALGRTFLAEEERPAGPSAVILSDHLWRTQFGADPAIVGRTINLNARPYRVVGVMPADFDFPAAADVWAPLPMPLAAVPESFKSYIPEQFIARLAPGVTVDEAATGLATFERSFPGWKDMADTTRAGIIKPLQRSLVPAVSRRPLLLLMASAALVLLIAIVNVTNLLLSRGTTRRREFGVRVALGATRGRVVRQLLGETMLLTCAGTLVGVAIAWLSIRVLNVFIPADLLAISRPTIDVRILGFTVVVALLVGLAVGVWPAMTATQSGAGEAIKSGDGHGTTSRRGVAARDGLVVVEFALAVMLLIGAGLMLQSFRALMETKSGLDPSHVTTAQITLPVASYPRSEARVFFDELLQRLRETPGVTHAGAVNALPLAAQARVAFQISAVDDRPLARNSFYSGFLDVTPDYFATMGIPILLGRDVSPADDSAAKVMVISRKMAERLWPGQDPVGRHLSLGNDRRTVIGVVGDVRSSSLDAPAIAEMYFPLRDVGSGDQNIVVRGDLPPGILAQRIRDAVRAIDPAQVVYNVQPMDDVLRASVAPRRVNAILLATFGGIALLLAMIGVYAVLAFSVAQRTREFGVRLAIGARGADLLRLVLRRGLALACIGTLLGIGGAFLAGRFIETLLYDVSARDPRVFVGAPAMLLMVALFATLIPAVRATRVDPLTALREE